MTVYQLSDSTCIEVLDETLEQMVCYDNDPVCRMDYEQTEKLVRTALFSAIPDRRMYTQRELKRMWDASGFVLRRVEEAGEIFSLISFTGEEGPYTLVGRYRADGPIEEEVPSQQEMKNWEE